MKRKNMEINSNNLIWKIFMVSKYKTRHGYFKEISYIFQKPAFLLCALIQSMMSLVTCYFVFHWVMKEISFTASNYQKA